MKSLWLLEALTCSRSEDGLSSQTLLTNPSTGILTILNGPQISWLNHATTAIFISPFTIFGISSIWITWFPWNSNSVTCWQFIFTTLHVYATHAMQPQKCYGKVSCHINAIGVVKMTVRYFSLHTSWQIRMGTSWFRTWHSLSPNGWSFLALSSFRH